MATVSVKIPVATLIEKLEGRLATLSAEADAHAEAMEKWAKDYAEYKAKAANALLAKLERIIASGDYSDLSINYWREARVGLTANVGEKAPEKPHYSAPTVRQGRKDVSERAAIEQSLSILRLTSQETVGASVYGSFSHLF